MSLTNPKLSLNTRGNVEVNYSKYSFTDKNKEIDNVPTVQMK